MTQHQFHDFGAAHEATAGWQSQPQLYTNGRLWSIRSAVKGHLCCIWVCCCWKGNNLLPMNVSASTMHITHQPNKAFCHVGILSCNHCQKGHTETSGVDFTGGKPLQFLNVGFILNILCRCTRRKTPLHTARAHLCTGIIMRKRVCNQGSLFSESYVASITYCSCIIACNSGAAYVVHGGGGFSRLRPSSSTLQNGRTPDRSNPRSPT